ncbi:hypothetical protein FCV25MIE_01672 [Fagus crenata]
MFVFSDWTAVSLKKSGEIFCIGPIAKGFSVLPRYFLNLKKINWSKSPDSTNCLEWTGQIIFRRCFEYLHRYNFIDYCLNEHPKLSSYGLDNFRNLEAAMGEEKENVDGVWVCEFKVWVLWVSKNDLVAGVGCCGGTMVVAEELLCRGGTLVLAEEREEIEEEEEDKGRKKKK